MSEQKKARTMEHSSQPSKQQELNLKPEPQSLAEFLERPYKFRPRPEYLNAANFVDVSEDEWN